MDDLHELNVPELRARLREHSLPTNGKKADLIKRLSVMADADPAPTVSEEVLEALKTTRKSARKSKKKSQSIDEDDEMMGDAEEVPKASKTSVKKAKKKSQSIAEEDEMMEEGEEEAPAAKKTSVKKGKKKSQSIDEEAVGEGEEEGQEVPKARKSSKKTKSSSSSSKKQKKGKVVEPEDDEEHLEDEVFEADDADGKKDAAQPDDVLNTSNQTYDVVSPHSENSAEDEKKDEEGTEKETKKEEKTGSKGPTPVRRPSECRRSIFKRFGLDPTKYTPASSTAAATTTTGSGGSSTAPKRRSSVAAAAATATVSSTTATPTTTTTPGAKRARRSMVLQLEEDTVEKMEPEEEEEAMEPIAEEVPEIAVEVDDEAVEDEEQEEGVEGQEIERGHARVDEEMSLLRTRAKTVMRAPQQYRGHNDGDGSVDPAFFSEDEPDEEEASERRDEFDQSMLSEVSSRVASAKTTPAAAAASLLLSQKRSAGRRSDLHSTTPTSSLATTSTAKPSVTKAPTPGATARSAGRMAPGARFAAAHAKLFEQQEFIGDTMAKKEERRAALAASASARTQRLATPKTREELRKPLRVQPAAAQQRPAAAAAAGFKFGSTALPKTFQFGTAAVSDIRKVQQKPSAIPAPTARLPLAARSKPEQKLDAKARAKTTPAQKKPVDRNPMLLPTIPDDSTFVERMATPKSLLSSANRAHRGAGGYQPKRGRVGDYVDTTKLSDREYELAMEAGLLPGGSKMNSKKSREQKREEEREREAERRNRARDDLVNVKRKLKLA